MDEAQTQRFLQELIRTCNDAKAVGLHTALAHPRVFNVLQIERQTHQKYRVARCETINLIEDVYMANDLYFLPADSTPINIENLNQSI